MWKILERIFNREEKVSWLQVSMARFGTIVPMIDWDEYEEKDDLDAHNRGLEDMPVETYNPTPFENNSI